MAGNKHAPHSKLWLRISKAWKKIIPSFTTKPSINWEFSLNLSLWFSTNFIAYHFEFLGERIAKPPSSKMCLSSEIWDSREADFKPFNVIFREFVLKEEESDNFSLMADQFEEQHAHLLI